MILDALQNEYVVMTGTDPRSAAEMDMELNSCGIPFVHSFSVHSAFSLTDSSGNQHDLVMVRNPWSTSGYLSEWSATDERW